ncbi:MAG: NnrU family protein [Rubrimonas sp.]
MLMLLMGLALWSAVHLFPVVARDRRTALIARHGLGPYKGAFSLALVAAIMLMVWGYRGAEVVHLFFPPPFLWHLNNLLMLVAFLIFGAGVSGSNIRRFIRHPQLTAVKIWAAAHLLVNGDLASWVLFGGLILWAGASVGLLNKRDGAWVRPPASPVRTDVIHVAVSVLLFVAVAFAHLHVFGVRPFPG